MSKFDFYFTRLMYDSGDWDVDIRMPSNVLNSLVRVHHAQSRHCRTCSRLVRSQNVGSAILLFGGTQVGAIQSAGKKNLERYLRGGGFLFVDDCNHDIDSGIFAKSFEAEIMKFSAKKKKFRIRIPCIPAFQI